MCASTCMLHAPEAHEGSSLACTCRTAVLIMPPPAMQYEFTISWPKRWATKGYTNFTFGFKTPEEARHWYSRISECLEGARARQPPPAPSASRSGGGWHQRTRSGNIVLSMPASMGKATEVRAAVGYGRSPRVTILAATHALHLMLQSALHRHACIALPAWHRRPVAHALPAVALMQPRPVHTW